MSNYEADVEAALASIKLEQSIEGQRRRLENMKAMSDFLRTHPDFKTFYDLYKKIDRYV